MRTPIVLGVIVLLVSGVNLFAANAKPATTAPDAPAQIYLFRPTSPPAARDANVCLDGKKIGEIFVRRYAVIQVPPGRHKLTMSFWDIKDKSVEWDCEPGKRYYISYTSLMGGIPVPAPLFVTFFIDPEMELVPEPVARRHINTFALAFTHGMKFAPGLPDVAEIIDVPDGKQAGEIHDTILDTARRYGWTLKEDTPGRVVIHQASKRWDCTFVIMYDTKAVFIHSDSKSSGKKAVPQGWIGNMKKGILRGLGV